MLGIRRLFPAAALVLGLAVSCTVPIVEPPPGGCQTPPCEDPPPPPPPGKVASKLELTNPDGLPRADRLVFSRIGSLQSPPVNGVHDRVTLRLTNPTDAAIQVTKLNVEGPWTVSPPTVPVQIAAKASAELLVTYRGVAADANSRTLRHEGKLTVETNEGQNGGGLIVELGGLWQIASENYQGNSVEPDLAQILAAFEFKTALTSAGTDLNARGRVLAAGDEVIAPYWRRADASKPVNVRQIAAFHGKPCDPAIPSQCDQFRFGSADQFLWHNANSSTRNFILRQAEVDWQSLLPRMHDPNDNHGPRAEGNFQPAGDFGLVVNDAEWSDAARNNAGPDRANGCKGLCGQHMRAWPLKNSTGSVVPNAYIVGMDFAGINYDYNDNVYLVTNVEPARLLYRIDVGGDAYTDPNGFRWSADQNNCEGVTGDNPGICGPTNAVAERPSPAPAVTGTDNPRLYETYRGYTGDATPQDQRVLNYRLPVDRAGTYEVRLHFAEVFWTEANKRVFDVVAEGTTILDDFDIFAAAGGTNKAHVRTAQVQVTDGFLNLDFRASQNFPAVSGIEVLRAAQ